MDFARAEKAQYQPNALGVHRCAAVVGIFPSSRYVFSIAGSQAFQSGSACLRRKPSALLPQQGRQVADAGAFRRCSGRITQSTDCQGGPLVLLASWRQSFGNRKSFVWKCSFRRAQFGCKYHYDAGGAHDGTQAEDDLG